jgi:N-acetylglucosamine-6-phosphate deacetylase
LGGLPASVSGGAARLKSNGALAGSVLRFNHAFRNVLEITGLPAKELARTVSLNQATALGLEALGRLEPGYKADIVLLDKSFEVRNVFVDGAPKV